MDDLVKRLSEGEHPVEVVLRPERNAAALKKWIDDYNVVHIKFTNTRGGTELGVTLDKNESDWKGADFENAIGRIKLAGKLKVNYVPVKCVAEIDLSTLAGTGHLDVLPEG
jgi:hypothetical protein